MPLLHQEHLGAGVTPPEDHISLPDGAPWPGLYQAIELPVTQGLHPERHQHLPPGPRTLWHRRGCGRYEATSKAVTSGSEVWTGLEDTRHARCRPR